MRLTKRLAAALDPNRGSIATDTELPERPLARRVLAFFPALPALCICSLLVTIQQWRGGERSLLPLTAFTRFQLPIRLPRWFVGPGPRRGFGEAGQRDRGFVIFSASLSSFGFNSSIERNDSFRTSTHCVSALDGRTQASTEFINPSPGECG